MCSASQIPAPFRVNKAGSFRFGHQSNQTLSSKCANRKAANHRRLLRLLPQFPSFLRLYRARKAGSELAKRFHPRDSASTARRRFAFAPPATIGSGSERVARAVVSERLGNRAETERTERVDRGLDRFRRVAAAKTGGKQRFAAGADGERSPIESASRTLRVSGSFSGRIELISTFIHSFNTLFLICCFLHFRDETAISVAISDLPFDSLDQLDLVLPSSRITNVFLPFRSQTQSESVLKSLCRVGLQLRHAQSSQSAGRLLLRTFATLSRRFCTTSDAYRSLFITYSVSIPQFRVCSTNNPCRTRVFPWRQVAKRGIRR